MTEASSRESLSVSERAGDCTIGDSGRIVRTRSSCRVPRALRIWIMIALTLGVVCGEFAIASSATIATDRLDYPPGDTVWITGSGFKLDVPSLTGELVELSVLHVGKSGLIENEYGPWSAQSDANGNFTSFWVVPYNDSIVGATLELTAEGLSSGLVATTRFTDANVTLTLATALSDTICPGDSSLPGSDSLYLCAQLLQGGCDEPLVDRPVIFYWNPGNCGVEDDAEGEDTVYTDANGYACTDLPIPDELGSWVLRVKFDGEGKPNPCPSPGNSACDPNNPNEAQRCVNLSASNICQSVTIDTVVCCTPPICSLGTITLPDACTPDTDFVAFTSSDPDDGLDGCVLYGPGELVSGGWLYEPVGGETVNVRIVCTNLCGDSCVTEFSRTYGERVQITCPALNDTTIIQCDPSEVALSVSATGATCELTNDSPGSVVDGYWVYTPSGDETVTVSLRCISTNSCDTCISSFSVTFDVNAPPTIVCPPDLTFECDSIGAFGWPTAEDDRDENPSVYVLSRDSIAGECPGAYILRVRYVAKDPCGDSAYCDQSITVQDSVSPVLVGCPDDITVFCNQLPPPALVSATDNCDPSVVPVYSESTFPTDCDGIITRRWIATDDCGNADTCEQIITIIPPPPPPPVCDTLCGTVYNTDCPDTTCLVADAHVQLWDSYPDGSVISTDTTDASGNFCFDVQPGVEYDLRIYRQGFCTDVFLDAVCGDELVLGLDSLDFEVPDSPLFHDFWSINAMSDGHLILPGDVIYACDSNGLIVGLSYVKAAGEYLIHIVGNVPKGPPDLIDEGADPGEVVSLWLNCECPILAPVGFVNFAETQFDAVFVCPTDTICDSLCGYVYDCDCDQKGDCGIDGATVELWSSYPDGQIIAVDTAAWGAFCFEVEPGVEYDLRFWKKGYCTDTVSNWSCEYGPLQFCLDSLDFTLPESPLFHDYYSQSATWEGNLILPGDVIYACDSNGIIVGVAYVDQPGTYLIHVLGNVPKLVDTVDEGADPGEKVSLWLNCECPVSVNEGFVNFGNTLFDAAWDCRVTGICCELCPGWSMFSYNFYLNDYSRENVLATIDLSYDAVRSGYCDEPTSPHLESWFANRPVNDLTDVNPWHGYDIHMTTADTLCIEGSVIPANTEIPLCEGWNYVPYYPMEADSREHALQSIAGNYTNVFNLWCDNFDSYNAARPEGANDLFCLYPCRGYWIKMTIADTLIYPMDGYDCAEPLAKTVPSYTSGQLQGSPVAADFWSNTAVSTSGLNAGDIITVLTESGMLVGEAQVDENGVFLVHVFGDVVNSAIVEGAQPGERLTFRVNGQAASVEGNTSFTDRENSQITVRASNSNAIPTAYELLQNYPNPFNAGTVIPFTMKDASEWTLTVYNIMGQTVQTFEGFDAPGTVRVNWNGLDRNGANVPSGVYFYRVTTDAWTATKKMTLLK